MKQIPELQRFAHFAVIHPAKSEYSTRGTNDCAGNFSVLKESCSNFWEYS